MAYPTSCVFCQSYPCRCEKAVPANVCAFCQSALCSCGCFPSADSATVIGFTNPQNMNPDLPLFGPIPNLAPHPSVQTTVGPLPQCFGGEQSPQEVEERARIKSILSSKSVPSITKIVSNLPRYIGPLEDGGPCYEQLMAIQDILFSECISAINCLFSPAGDVVGKAYLTLLETVMMRLYRNDQFESLSNILEGVFKIQSKHLLVSLFRLTICNAGEKYRFIIKSRNLSEILNADNIQNSLIIATLRRDRRFFVRIIVATKDHSFSRLLTEAIWTYYWGKDITKTVRDQFYGQSYGVDKGVALSNKMYLIDRPRSPAAGADVSSYIHALFSGREHFMTNGRSSTKLFNDYVETQVGFECTNCEIYYEPRSLYLLKIDRDINLTGKFCPVCRDGILSASSVPSHLGSSRSDNVSATDFISIINNFK